MKKMMAFLLLVHVLFSFWACRLMEELLHSSPPEVLSCRLEPDCFVLCFSAEMNRNLTESALTVLEEDDPVEIGFLWNKNDLSCTPHAGVQKNRNYTVLLDSSAEDSYGNSLSETFNRFFPLREDGVSPEILSVL
ncbi:MAG: Ig-like domain-containing protein, partial [Spirochaetales bacterium]|nr:Ig-like domain-containing protein [Spirochaetales bacterium]